MINHIWTIICSKSIVDAETNNVSLLDVIEHIGLNREPPLEENEITSIPITFEVLSLWERSPSSDIENANARMQIQFPDSTLHQDMKIYNLDLGSSIRLRNRTTMNGFPFKGFGRYAIIIEIDQESDGNNWRKVAEIPLQIEQSKTESS